MLVLSILDIPYILCDIGLEVKIGRMVTIRVYE
jgi:hypothetical protein